jgi:sugar phosphate isomerase/epimerase
MRFGCCVDLELMDTAAEVGYDFVELPSSVLLVEQSETCFRPVCERLRAAPIGAEVWELRLPADLAVCGPAVQWPRVSRYVNTAFQRVAALRGTVVSFPCGGCCDVPHGISVTDARAQLCDFLRVCAAVARGQGVVVGIEALPASRPHLVNSIPDAMALASELNRPEVGVVANCAELLQANHSLLDIADAAGWLAYVHVSAVNLQVNPRESGYLEEVSRALRFADYGGRIAVQGEWDSPRAEMERSLAALRYWFQHD